MSSPRAHNKYTRGASSKGPPPIIMSIIKFGNTTRMIGSQQFEKHGQRPSPSGRGSIRHEFAFALVRVKEAVSDE